MEFPGGWTALVASLSVVDLDDPQRSWRFLRAQGLVNDVANGPDALAKATAEEVGRGRITGGSLAYRIAEQLVKTGLTQPSALERDPFGKLAAVRWETFLSAESR